MCTGLYTDIKNKKITPGIEAYAPGFVLWSDGAQKERWIYLPKGKKIDTSDMGKWVFPVGTKLFKQFSAGGRRMETRLYQKIDDSDEGWSNATYVWSKTEAYATRETAGADVDLGDTVYHVPEKRACDQCHKGRAERILGFEAVALGQDEASGLTLQKLIDKKLITDKPEHTSMTVGDDGTGLASPVLGWIHMNCGVSCHNDRPASEAYKTGLRLRLDPDLLDGRASNDFESETTTIGAPAKVIRFQGETRIVPGDPDSSLLYKLIMSREGKTDQMPPIATEIIDEENNARVRDWILRMEPGDAGALEGPD